MNIRLIPVLLISCIFVTGCETQWKKTGTTVEQVNADIQACEQRAAEQFPVLLSSSDTSNRKEYVTRCTNYGNQTNCTTRSSDTGGSYQYDRNEEKRRQAISECMESRGYSH